MSIRLDASEVIGALEKLAHDHPEQEEILLRAQMAVHELAISGGLTVSEWSEKQATLHERRAHALFAKLNPSATDDEYPE